MKAMFPLAIVIAAAPALAQETDPATLRLGQRLYAANCAACHGANLQGQPDWKRRLDSGRMPAPPHDVTGHTWHHSDRDLFTLTNRGVAAVAGEGYESDMPGFGDRLSEAEITAVLDYIKSTWPLRARQTQAAISAAEGAVTP